MNPNFADWYRSASLNPSGDLLKSRWEAINAFIKKADQELILDLIPAYFLNDVQSTSFAKLAEGFQSNDAAFTLKGNANELRVLAGAMLVGIIEKNNELSDITALAVLCFSFNKKFEHPVPEIYRIAEHHLFSKDFRFRERDFEDVPANAVKKINDEITKFNAGPSFDTIKPVLTQLIATYNQQHSALKTLENRLNNRLEESQVLWWLFGELSVDFNRHFKELGEASWIVASKELSNMTVLSTGFSSAQAFLTKAIELSIQTEPVTISSSANALPENDYLKEFSNVSPQEVRFLHLISSLNASATGSSAHLKQEEEKSFPPAELALQLYREILLQRLLEA